MIVKRLDKFALTFVLRMLKTTNVGDHLAILNVFAPIIQFINCQSIHVSIPSAQKML